MSQEAAASAPIPAWILNEMPPASDDMTAIPSRTTKAAPRGRPSRVTENSGIEALAAAITTTSTQNIEFNRNMITLLLGKRRERSPQSSDDEDNERVFQQREVPSRPFSPTPLHDQELEWFVRDCRQEKNIVISAELIMKQSLNLQHLAAGFINSQMLVALLGLTKGEARSVVKYAKEWYSRLAQKRAQLVNTVSVHP
jgi:hypothetical protein